MIGMSAYFPLDTMEEKRQCSNIIKMLIEKTYKSRIAYMAKISFANKVEIKIPSDKRKRKFVVSRLVIQKKY